ncbi:MAG TPA: ABC transporter ATP-binding protein, partial [Roseiarcus sp.]|nr:ABC transporter ATP-binding protein [Roseiarcus sp.]
DDFMELVLYVVAATGCAFLMVTHSARLAARVERQVRLSAGVIERP